MADIKIDLVEYSNIQLQILVMILHRTSLLELVNRCVCRSKTYPLASASVASISTQTMQDIPKGASSSGMLSKCLDLNVDTKIKGANDIVVHQWFAKRWYTLLLGLKLLKSGNWC